MNDYEYSIWVDGVIMAKGMTLGTALIFVEALFQKWHSETDTKICIQKELIQRCELAEE